MTNLKYSSHIRLLEEAKKYLTADPDDPKKTRFICNAVARASQNIYPSGAYRIRDMIMNAIAPHTTLESWLRQSGKIDIGLFDAPGREAMYQYRLRWIDHLISLLKEED